MEGITFLMALVGGIGSFVLSISIFVRLGRIASTLERIERDRK